MDIKHLVKLIKPALDCSGGKGDLGKLAVIGGSFEYTGAPYYSAMASLKAGGELAHIFCTPMAATPIKSYSPECIVHPLLLDVLQLYTERVNNFKKYILVSSLHSLYFDHFKTVIQQEANEKNLKGIIRWMDTMSAVVIGSGLGRDPNILSYIPGIIQSTELLTIIDADAIWLLIQDLYNLKFTIQQKSKNIIITPNKGEMDRMCKWLNIPQTQQTQNLENTDPIQQLQLNDSLVSVAVQVSQALNNSIIIQKGMIDIITDGREAYVVNERASPKRFGGQGDILTGLLSTYTHWANRKNLNPLIGCIVASYLTRRSSYLAYSNKKLSTSCPDVLQYIGHSWDEVALDC